MKKIWTLFVTLLALQGLLKIEAKPRNAAEELDYYVDDNFQNSHPNDVYAEDSEDDDKSGRILAHDLNEDDTSYTDYSSEEENEDSEKDEANYEVHSDEDKTNTNEEDLTTDASEETDSSYKDSSAEDLEDNESSQSSQEEESTEIPEEINPVPLPEQYGDDNEASYDESSNPTWAKKSAETPEENNSVPFLEQYGDENEAMQPISKQSPVDDSQFSDEIMQTADTMVFRPFFRYRKQSVEKKKIYKDNSGNVYSKPNKSPGRLADSIPPVLVYDKKTGGYHPLPQYKYYSYHSNPYSDFYKDG